MLMEGFLLEQKAGLCYKRPVCNMLRLNTEYYWCASGVTEKYEEFEFDLDD